jgi:anti-anti-sigma factor
MPAERDGLTLAISGEIDLSNAQEFRSELELLIDGETDQVTLDLHECGFIDSTAIEVLLRVAQAQRERGQPLGLCRLAPEPRRVLEVAGILDSKLFRTYPDPPPSDE